MKHSLGWGGLLLASLFTAACARGPATTEKTQPSYLEPIEGTDLKRVVLTAKAAERLGIQTTPVLEQEVVRKRAVGGQVVSALDPELVEPGTLWVRVALSQSELSQVDPGRLALILPLEASEDEEDADEADEELFAEWDEGPGDDDEEAPQALYYQVRGSAHGLSPGQRVLIELTLSGSHTMRKVIPYTAVLYDVQGNTWVYTNPGPLVYVRESVVVDYIEGGLVVLSEGPALGTEIVTVGVAELYGAETGVSK